MVMGKVEVVAVPMVGAVPPAANVYLAVLEVEVGAQVKVSIKGSQHTFNIVGEWEADPKEKKISHESPLGKALIGKKVGEVVEVDAPAGKVEYTILGIE